MLLDVAAPRSGEKSREGALAKLALLYFQSHGPASLKDFIWWSGLTAGDSRAGLEQIKSQLSREEVEGDTYWFSEYAAGDLELSPPLHLLPAYDEYYLGYKNRDAVLNPRFDKNAVSSSGVFRPMIVIDGQIKGIWKYCVSSV